MQKFNPKMNRKQTLTCFLLAFLVAACGYNFYTPTMIQTKESVNFKLGALEPRSRSEHGYILATRENTRKQIEEKKAHKVPSGPSPIGNQHPPSKPCT